MRFSLTEILKYLIGIFAEGPGAYLFHGVVEQQYVFHVMDYALCLSESKQKSCERHVSRGGKPRTSSEAFVMAAPSLHTLFLTAALLFLQLLSSENWEKNRTTALTRTEHAIELIFVNNRFFN